MAKNTINKISLLVNFILIVILIIYVFVPFLGNGVVTKTFSVFCGIKKVYQGEQYLPAWCTAEKKVDNQPVVNDNVNQAANENSNANTNTNTANTQMANPASVNCEKVEGSLEMVKSEDGGEYGLCVFKDKSICDEWDLFRGDCQAGKCFKECQAGGTSSEGWYNSCTKKLIKYEDCSKEDAKPTPTPATAATADKNIVISAPLADAQLASPIELQGRAKTADSKVYVRVKSKSGQNLIEVSGSLKNIGSDGFGDFSLKISYEFSTTKEGFIEVYALDKDGKDVDNVSIPVKF